MARPSLLDTEICRIFKTRYPIWNVGFGSGARAELAAAVSNAGGLGVIGGTHVPVERIAEEVAKVRALTDKPFGVNFILQGIVNLPNLADLIRERILRWFEVGAPVIVFFWGDPAEFVKEAHRAGTKVVLQAGSVDEARAAKDAGVDAIIAQGFEAGGHVKSHIALATFLPTVVDAVAPLPVLAAGGIADGRGIVAALDLGAQGVSLGTRFVASREAYVRDEYKERLVSATAEDTYYTDLYDVGWPNAPHRTLRTKAIEEWEAAGRPPIGKRPAEGVAIGIEHRPWGDVEVKRYAPFMLTPDFDGQAEYAPLWAGESVELVRDVKPAGDIVRDLVREAEEVLARRV